MHLLGAMRCLVVHFISVYALLGRYFVKIGGGFSKVRAMLFIQIYGHLTRIYAGIVGLIKSQEIFHQGLPIENK